MEKGNEMPLDTTSFQKRYGKHTEHLNKMNILLSPEHYHLFYILCLALLNFPVLKSIMPIRINLCSCELSRRHSLLEQQIQLSISPALRLRQPEVYPNDYNPTCTCPKVCGFGAPVPGGFAELVILEYISMRNVKSSGLSLRSLP